MYRAKRGLCGVAVALAAAVMLGAPPTAEAGGKGPRPFARSSKSVRGKYPSLGPKNAKVVIEVYGSFQCPYTRRLAPTLPQVATAFPKKVRIVWRDFPLVFHRQAMDAAIAGRAVWRQKGAKAYMAYAQLVFTNYRSLSRSVLVQYAVKAGATRSKVVAALNSPRSKATIQAEMKKAQKRGVRATPTILINGAKYGGSRTLSAFRQHINSL